MDNKINTASLYNRRIAYNVMSEFLSDLGDSINGFRCTRLGHDIQISNHTFIGHRGLLVVFSVVAHENWQNMNETDRDANASLVMLGAHLPTDADETV